MNTKDFIRLGVPLGEATRRATDFVRKFILGGGDKIKLHAEVSAIVANPSAFAEDPLRGEFAKALISTPHPGPTAVEIRDMETRLPDPVAEGEAKDCATSPQPSGFPSPPRDGFPTRDDRFAKRGPPLRGGEGEEPAFRTVKPLNSMAVERRSGAACECASCRAWET
jgi:hypothetical protein